MPIDNVVHCIIKLQRDEKLKTTCIKTRTRQTSSLRFAQLEFRHLSSCDLQRDRGAGDHARRQSQLGDLAKLRPRQTYTSDQHRPDTRQDTQTSDTITHSFKTNTRPPPEQNKLNKNMTILCRYSLCYSHVTSCCRSVHVSGGHQSQSGSGHATDIT